jgi:heterodisulfide reductase subunit C
MAEEEKIVGRISEDGSIGFAEEAPKEVILDPDFKYEVANQPGGEHILRCFACGTCTASCPIREINDQYSPRKIIRQIMLGMRDEVLSSEFIWHCANCNNCYEHCPQDVRFTDISHALKKMALKEAEAGNIKLKGAKPAFDRYFVENFISHGRLYEMGLMSRYFMRNPDLKAILGYVPVGLKMLQTGKLKILPSNIKNVKEVKEKFLSVLDEKEDLKLNLLPTNIRKAKDVTDTIKFVAGEAMNVKNNLIPSNVGNAIEAGAALKEELMRFSLFVMEEKKEE